MPATNRSPLSPAPASSLPSTTARSLPSTTARSLPPAIEFRAASRVHSAGPEPVQALRKATFTVQRGELLAVMGPSGSGKTTLLNLAGGLDRPTEGDVLIDGVSLVAASPAQTAKIRRTTVGYVFQNYNLIPTLSTVENVALPLELDGLKAHLAQHAALDALREVGIVELAARFPADLSGGQAQRVAIARALVGTRDILLADEPTGALDSRTSDAIIQLLRERADAGAAVVLVTHEARLAAWADRVIYLKDGQIADDTGATEDASSAQESASRAADASTSAYPTGAHAESEA